MEVRSLELAVHPHSYNRFFDKVTYRGENSKEKVCAGVRQTTLRAMVPLSTIAALIELLRVKHNPPYVSKVIITFFGRASPKATSAALTREHGTGHAR